MTDTTPRIVSCPTCGDSVKWARSNKFRPFCSERCRLIDFGSWAGEQHSIPGEASIDDVLPGDLDE